jgi:hypothetical protein
MFIGRKKVDNCTLPGVFHVRTKHNATPVFMGDSE